MTAFSRRTLMARPFSKQTTRTWSRSASTRVAPSPIHLQVTDSAGLSGTADSTLTIITVPGDINYDGMANLLDLDILGENYHSMLPDPRCDLNGDGRLDLLDLDILGQHYGESLGGTVPEPVMLSLLALGGVAVIRRRRK